MSLKSALAAGSFTVITTRTCKTKCSAVYYCAFWVSTAGCHPRGVPAAVPEALRASAHQEAMFQVPVL